MPCELWFFDRGKPAGVKPLHSARKAFDPLAERLKGLTKQVDHLFKLAERSHTEVGKYLSALDGAAREGLPYDRRGVGKLIKQLDEARQAAGEQIHRAIYHYRQAVWLLDRFPDAKLIDVAGLVKLASLAETEAADWSLTPGRYVGVAPAEADEEFDFEQTMRDIHAELAELNEEAVELAAVIQKNFAGLDL